jgi:hypothetical protein
MPVTKTEVNVAQEVINVLLGDKGEAQAYSENPEGWLDSHGYADVSAEALATCGVGGGGGGGGAGASASASASAGVAPPPISAGATAQLDYIVYNNYYEDNSITNNIENHGDLDFQQVVGDNNVTAGDDIENSQVQTGDGVQVDDSVLQDTNIETGEGDQLIDESVNTNTAVSGTGDAQAGSAGGDLDQTTHEAPPEEAPEEPAEPIL